MKNNISTICVLILLITACQPRTVLHSEETAQSSNTPILKTTPSRTPVLVATTYQVSLPRETLALPTEKPQPTRWSNNSITPSPNDDWRQTPTIGQEEISTPTATFDTMFRSTVYLMSFKGPFSAFELRGKRLVGTIGLNDDRYPNSPGQYPGGSRTKNLAFANDSPFVAYIRGDVNQPKAPRELWIADLSLKNIEKVWIDEDNWLGDIGDAFVDGNSDIVWGPFDRYILMWSYLPEKSERMIVYDIERKEVYKWTGDCNRLAKSQLSNRLSVWCIIQNGDMSYAVLEPDGVFFTKTAPEKFFADTRAWRFSPDGDRVLFLGDDLRWRFTDQNQQTNDIPVRYVENFRYSSPKAMNFQWSRDSQRLLVFGKPDDLSLCPYPTLDINSKAEKRGCWFVIDTQTRGVIWSITESVIATVNLSVENASIDYNAALSPDGQFVILTITDFRLGYRDYLVVTSLVTGESAEIKLDHGLLPGYKILWIKKPSW